MNVAIRSFEPPLRGPTWMRVGCLVAVFVGVAPSTALAQHSIRGWGRVCFDTEARNGKFTDIDVGHGAAFVRRDDGRIFGQGQNSMFQSWLAASLELPSPPSGRHYVMARTGGSFSLGLLDDGAVIGCGNWVQSPSQPAAPPLPSGTRYVDMEVGGLHALLLRSDGVMVGMGLNVFGQCNVPAFPAGESVLKMCPGPDYSMVVLSGGSIVAWGWNGAGRCNVPTLPPGVGYIDVAASSFMGTDHVLALRSDGQIVAWGDNSLGQCNVPPLPPQTRYRRIGASTTHSVAWRSDGVFVAWGSNANGELNVPTVPAGIECMKLCGGVSSTMALMSDGSILDWGLNFQFNSLVQVLPRGGAAPVSYRQMDVGWEHVMVTLSDGTIQGLGHDYYVPGFLSLPPGTNTKVVRVAAGAGINAVLQSDGNILAWDIAVPPITVPPPLPGERYVDVVAGYTNLLGLTSTGRAVHCGQNLAGEGNIPSPPPGVRYVGAAVEWGKTLLLRSDGRVVALGTSSGGQLNVPPLPPGHRYVQVAAPAAFSVALRSDGQLLVWGNAPSDPTQPWGTSWVPLPPLPPGVTYVEISGLDRMMAARRSDGMVVTCGYSGVDARPAPPLDPGTSYVEIGTAWYFNAARVGPTSTYVTFATGCAGSRPATRLVPTDTPRIGRRHEINLFDLPADIAVLALGFTRLPPTPLAALGMPGCDLQISIDDIAVVTGQTATASHSVMIPDLPALIGVHFYQQALVPDAGAGNGALAVVSNAAEGVIGDW